MSELAASSADIIELIERLTRAGYRVSFTSRYGSIMPDIDIVIEALAMEEVGKEEPRHTLLTMIGAHGIPLVLHPNGDGILKELERAANLLASAAF